MTKGKADTGTEWVPLNRIEDPSGPWRKVAEVSITMTAGVAPTEWLDTETVTHQLLIAHQVTVKKVSRHYETVRGFNSLAVARSICPDDHLLPVTVSDQSEGELLKLAVFDLVYTTLLYSGISTKQRQKAYWVLKDMFAEMRVENIPVPAELTTGSVRRMLRLSTNQTKQPRVRHSELARTLAGS